MLFINFQPLILHHTVKSSNSMYILMNWMVKYAFLLRFNNHAQAVFDIFVLIISSGCRFVQPCVCPRDFSQVDGTDCDLMHATAY